MEIDLAQAPSDLEALEATLCSSVCIIGAGIAGLTLARLLVADGGPGVTLLEAGGRTPETVSGQDPFAAEMSGRLHEGTRKGRVRALGGCSLTWGGQLLAAPKGDEEPGGGVTREGALDSGSVLGLSRLLDNQPATLAAYGLAEPPLLGSLPELTRRLSRFLPFSQRNFARSLDRQLRRKHRLRVALHANVTELVLSRSLDRIEHVAARAPDGRFVRIAADQFVLAAGTVETCRLLLASRSVASRGVGNDFGQVGLGFHDHLTVAVAEFTGPARSRVLAELRPWILRTGWVRWALHSLKLEPNRALRAQLRLNACMAHITIVEPETSPLGALRTLLRARQESVSPRARLRGLKLLPQIGMQIVRLGWEAVVRGRRAVSPHAKVFLQLNIAQDTPSTSSISLAETGDSFGITRALVHWGVSEAELGTLRRFAGYLRERLTEAGLRDGVLWESSLFAEGPEADARLLTLVDDARHAMGGACMGTDPRTSVVDPELRVHGVANLSVASPAVFPDGRAQLPTQSLLELCRQLALRLRRECL